MAPKNNVISKIVFIITILNCISLADSTFNVPDIFNGNTVLYKQSGQTIQQAVDGIVNASKNNPYVLIIPEGLYTEQVTLPDYVSLCGLDKNLCKIVSGIPQEWLANGDPKGITDNPCAVIVGGKNSSIANLTIEVQDWNEPNSAMANCEMLGFRMINFGGGQWNVYNCTIYGREDAVGFVAHKYNGRFNSFTVVNISNSELYGSLYAIDFYAFGRTGFISQVFLMISESNLYADYPLGGLGCHYDLESQQFPVAAIRVSTGSEPSTCYSISITNSVLDAEDHNLENTRVTAGLLVKSYTNNNLMLSNTIVSGSSNGLSGSKGYGLLLDESNCVNCGVFVSAEESTFSGDTFDISNLMGDATISLFNSIFSSSEGTIYKNRN